MPKIVNICGAFVTLTISKMHQMASRTLGKHLDPLKHVPKLSLRRCLELGSSYYMGFTWFYICNHMLYVDSPPVVKRGNGKETCI